MTILAEWALQMLRVANRVPISREYELLSLDVFDTCLIRDFVSQESLWFLVGQEIRNQLPGVTNPAEFARLRERADRDARMQCVAEDITLPDVYIQLASMCGWNPEQQRKAMEIEELLEFRGLRLNPAAKGLLTQVRGVRVSYLSDTQHRAAFIRNYLDAQALPAGVVLSSGDLGLRKASGSMFREAGKLFGISCDQILHVGNDLEIDGLGSAAAGVAFAPMLAANPTRYELALDSAAKEYGGLLGATLAGVSRDFRLGNADKSPTGILSVVSSNAGPVIFAAAIWALLSAQQDNIDTLYFVARDGEILLAVAELIQRELGVADEIECRYLFGSRKAWYLPALGLGSNVGLPAAIRCMLVWSEKNTLRGLLSMLDISVEEAVSAAPDALKDFSPDARLEARGAAIPEALINSQKFQELVLDRAKKACEATTAYLAQEKMFSGARVGLVDIGWRGSEAASLMAIASEQGTDVSFYFAGGLSGRRAQIAPKDSRAFLIDTRSGADAELDSPLMHLLESFCAGSGGSTLGYMTAEDGEYVPRLAPAGSNMAMAWGLSDYQILICSYAVNVCHALAKFEWTVSIDEVRALSTDLLSNLRALWSHPTYEEAKAWGSFPFEGDNRTRILAEHINLDYCLRFFSKAAKGRRSAIIWKRAAIMRSIGGNPLGAPLLLLQLVSQRQLRRLWILARARFARRPWVRVANVHVREGKIAVIKQWRM